MLLHDLPREEPGETLVESLVGIRGEQPKNDRRSHEKKEGGRHIHFGGEVFITFLAINPTVLLSRRDSVLRQGVALGAAGVGVGVAETSGVGTAPSFTGVLFPVGKVSVFWQPADREQAAASSPARKIDGATFTKCMG